MKTRAAIAYAAGKPLEVVTLDLEGPKAGEVLVELKATGICHTDEFTRSGADPEGLLKPKAFVVLKADAKTGGLHEALKEHVKQKIGPWKYPRWIEVVESLPKTATGKIQRFKLRDGK